MKDEFLFENKTRFPGAYHLDISHKGRKIGWVDTTSVKNMVIIENIRIEPQFQHQGLASMLLTQLEKLAESDNARYVTRIGLFCESESITDWVKSVQFFTHRGYKNFGVMLIKNLNTSSRR